MLVGGSQLNSRIAALLAKFPTLKGMNAHELMTALSSYRDGLAHLQCVSSVSDGIDGGGRA